MGEMRIGSDEHKNLFCRVFIDTHRPYKPAEFSWPELDTDARERLRALPFWEEAVHTEKQTAAKVQALAEIEPDPLVREAIALQGYEEGRHAALLQMMTECYGIGVAPRPEPQLPVDVEGAFLRTGYGECLDSFFAFGLFAIAKDSGFFPPELVTLFEPIVQEEARHILFFVNWVAYRRAQRPNLLRPWHRVRCVMELAGAAYSRLKMVRSGASDGFTASGSRSINNNISVRSILERSLAENERRLGMYDRRLLRPRIAPAMTKILLTALW